MPENVRVLHYQDAKALADQGIPARVLIMAAMLVDDDDSPRLAEAYPNLFHETMQRRWNSGNGELPGDAQDHDQPTKLEALGRDD